MLQNYLDLLKQAANALTSLGKSNATWSDYIDVVCYEIIVLLIGIAYVAGVVVIIGLPIFICKKIHTNIDTAFKQHIRDVQKYNDFVAIYQDKCSQLNKDIVTMDKYREILDLLDSKHIPHQTLKDITNKSAWQIIQTLPDIQRINVYSTVIQNSLGDFAGITNTKGYGSFHNMEHFGRIKETLACVPFFIIYAIFVIPLILMLF